MTLALSNIPANATMRTICSTCEPLSRGSYEPVLENGAWVDIADQPYTVFLERDARARQVRERVGVITPGIAHTCFICDERRNGGVVALCEHAR